jgi:hypothetical protein
MGKGGGKCASREQSASSSRTPRLPASRFHKSPAEVSSSKKELLSSKEKVTGSDPTTLVPLIPKVRFRLFTRPLSRNPKFFNLKQELLCDVFQKNFFRVRHSQCFEHGSHYCLVVVSYGCSEWSGTFL